MRTRKRRIYDTARWQRVRRRQLAREPFCRGCADQDRDTIATEVDHVTPLARGGAAYDPANLQSLCAACHTNKTRHYDMRGCDWNEWLSRGCDEHGNPRDPSHPWYSVPPAGE